MIRPGFIVAVVIAAVATAAPRVGHALGPLDVLVDAQAARAARIDTGLQTGVVGWLAYGQRLPAFRQRELAVEVRFGMPLVRPDLGDSGLEAGVQLDLWRSGRLRLRSQMDLGVRTLSTTVFDGFELLARETLSFGWHTGRGGIGVDLGWEQGLATHIRHSDWYRNEIYLDAEDGWIAFPAGRLRLGLFGGVAMGKHVVGALRLGIDWDRTGRQDYVPLVAVITAAWRV